MNIYILRATKNIAVAINGKKRQNFSTDDKILVGEDEYRQCRMLGFDLVSKHELTVDIIESKVANTPIPANIDDGVCLDCVGHSDTEKCTECEESTIENVEKTPKKKK